MSIIQAIKDLTQRESDDFMEAIGAPVFEPSGNVRVLANTIGGVDVLGANLRARHAYAMAWAARFHFPVPVELLDRWWPEGA